MVGCAFCAVDGGYSRAFLSLQRLSGYNNVKVIRKQPLLRAADSMQAFLKQVNYTAAAQPFKVAEWMKCIFASMLNDRNHYKKRM